MKKKLSILIALVMAISLCLTPAVALAQVGLTGGSYENTLNLENKDAAWAIKPGDGIGGTLGYNSAGTTFDWGLDAHGIADGSYALIYYADFSGARFGTWGGNNPGAVIATVTASGNIISTSGSVNLAMDLPCPFDANQFEHDYSGTPDFYTVTDVDGHAHGAKIWLVPTSALTGGTSLPVTAWPPTDNWLFETDLVWYDDTDVTSNVVAITVSPTTINFGILTPGQTGIGGNVTVTNSGNVPIDVTVPGMAAGNVFHNLHLDANFASAYTASLGATELLLGQVVVAVTLPVPVDYVPLGPEIGTLVFIATSQ